MSATQTSFVASFFAGRNGAVISRTPSGKIAFPSNSFITAPKAGDKVEVVIETEREKVAFVSPLNTEFRVCYTQVDHPQTGKKVWRFVSDDGKQYVIGFDWDWSSQYPEEEEYWWVSIQTRKNGEVYVLPTGNPRNPFGKHVYANHPRAAELVGCWYFSSYFSTWKKIQAIVEDEYGKPAFQLVDDEGKITIPPMLDGEGFYRQRLDGFNPHTEKVLRKRLQIR